MRCKRKKASYPVHVVNHTIFITKEQFVTFRHNKIKKEKWIIEEHTNVKKKKDNGLR